MKASGSLVCCAMRLGYGPSAKLLVIAQELRQRGVWLVFIGSGIAHELVSRSRGIFETVLCCQPDDPRAINAVRSSVGMLSVMDREFATLATQMGKPLYVVDSLLWMRSSIPTEFHAATIYWAQRFVAENERAVLPLQPRVVGPIISAIPERRDTTRNEIVVNLGGCEASADRELDQAYADFVVGGLINFRKVVTPSKSFVVLAGKRCTESLRAKFKDAGIEFASLRHDEVLLRIQSTEMVLTSPGLTATLECFGRGTPTYFLPPQNFSQWCILRRLRAARLAPLAMHWEDVQDVRLDAALPHTVRNPIVRRAILEGISRRSAADIFHESLMATNRGNSDHVELAVHQQKFFQSLGSNGAVAIAENLAVSH